MLLPINHKENLLGNTSFGINISEKKQPYDFNIELGVENQSQTIKTFNIVDAPHALIGGTTKSGKSVFMNVLVSSLIAKNSPEELKLVLIDPKEVELAAYSGIPHLACPIVNFQKEALIALNWLVNEMNNRYSLLRSNGVKTIEALRETRRIQLPSIICIIDELSNLIRKSNQKEFESLLIQIAEKARACGIHLIVATQRPSMGAVVGDLKSNLPTRIAFRTTSAKDSNIILDKSGAQKLNGKGNFLLSESFSDELTNVQGFYISENDINSIVNFWKKQNIDSNFLFDFNREIITPKLTEKKNVISDEEVKIKIAKVTQLRNQGILLKEITNEMLDKTELLDINVKPIVKKESLTISFTVKEKTDQELYREMITYIKDREDVSIEQIMHFLEVDKIKAGQLATKAITSKIAYRAYRNISSPYASKDKVAIYWN
jgi:DNA segregation ATPase FtsK/SpoIIIE-like protein